MLHDGIEKAEAILLALDLSGYEVLIETGTSYGETLAQVEMRTLARVYTIENDYEKYLNAQETLEGTGARIIYADSAIHLPRLMDFLKDSCVIFLDAHAVEDEPTPVLLELEHIFYRKDKRHWVLIDDARLFEEYTMWPSLNVIETIANKMGYSFKVNNDIIYLKP